ncbi:transmembrane protein 65-like isoform X1 [Antedon mediterranea]|uniref:transmembrane protein 65-like isoform X1 n=1 Tax=Antedon mediterranea TaxID=105859 RepID=UPI003AF897E4
MYIAKCLCGSLFTVSMYRGANITLVKHSIARGRLGLRFSRQHQQFDGRWQRSMTITAYKKRRRMLFSGGIPRDQFDNEEKSREFAMELLPNEQDFLLTELHKLKSKRENEDVNVSDRLTADPTYLNDTVPGKPTKVQLRLVTLSHAIPFIGFGFLDNAIMIMAGDYIDLKIGTALGISTMAAAGFGNLISDIAGLGLAGYVEALAIKLGIPMPQLTPDQFDMVSTRWAAYSGKAIGIIIGCLLGMFPLLFLETRNNEKADPSHGS